MSDHLDRAAEVIAAKMHGLTTPSMCRGIAQALEEAGLLVSPERDAAVAALERLKEFATWVVNLDKVEFVEERRTVTLTKIIDRAAEALDHGEEQSGDS